MIMTKSAIKRAESQSCLSSSEREQAQLKVNDEWNISTLVLN